MAFVALIAANSVLIFSNRSSVTGLSLRGINRVSYWVLGGTVFGLLAITCIPMLAEPFGFTPIAWGRWLAAFGIGAATFVLYEAVKLFLLSSSSPSR